MIVQRKLEKNLFQLFQGTSGNLGALRSDVVNTKLQAYERVEVNRSSPVLLGHTEEDVSTVPKVMWSHFGVLPNPFLKQVQESGLTSGQ